MPDVFQERNSLALVGDLEAQELVHFHAVDGGYLLVGGLLNEFVKGTEFDEAKVIEFLPP